MIAIWTQLAYLVISICMTIYVAQSLHKSGRVFLLRTFEQDEVMADSVNHLLLVGFYLINIGWVVKWTAYGFRPIDLEGAAAFVTSKVGTVMLILGCMHFVNLWFFWRILRGPVKEEAPVIKQSA